MEYIGIYGATDGRSGCVKQFATTASPTQVFPPSVSYACDLCNKDHSFRFLRSHVVATPNARRRLYEYLSAARIEPDVELS